MTPLPFLALPEHGPVAAEMERLADELRRAHFTAANPTVGPPDLDWDEIAPTERDG